MHRPDSWSKYAMLVISFSIYWIGDTWLKASKLFSSVGNVAFYETSIKSQILYLILLLLEWAIVHLLDPPRCRYIYKGFALLEIDWKLQNFGKDGNWNKPQNQDIDTKLVSNAVISSIAVFCEKYWQISNTLKPSVLRVIFEGSLSDIWVISE